VRPAAIWATDLSDQATARRERAVHEFCVGGTSIAS